VIETSKICNNPRPRQIVDVKWFDETRIVLHDCTNSKKAIGLQRTGQVSLVLHCYKITGSYEIYTALLTNDILNSRPFVYEPIHKQQHKKRCLKAGCRLLGCYLFTVFKCDEFFGGTDFPQVHENFVAVSRESRCAKNFPGATNFPRHRDDAWGVRGDVLASDWPFALNETRGGVWRVMSETDG